MPAGGRAAGPPCSTAPDTATSRRYPAGPRRGPASSALSPPSRACLAPSPAAPEDTSGCASAAGMTGGATAAVDAGLGAAVPCRQLLDAQHRVARGEQPDATERRDNPP
jgi:hypothetical protein